MLREVGCLITAIVVAGRSGSAFTAQIGTMKLNQEIDAMRTIGLNTVEVLVLPRLLGLMVALPLLTFVANLMGLIGGAMMCYFHLGITVPSFTRQLYTVLTIDSWTFWLGFIKAPFSPSSSCSSDASRACVSKAMPAASEARRPGPWSNRSSWSSSSTPASPSCSRCSVSSHGDAKETQARGSHLG